MAKKKNLMHALVGHFSTAPIADAQKDLEIISAIVSHRQAAVVAVKDTPAPKAATPKANKAAAPKATAAAADTPAKRKRGRPAKGQQTNSPATTLTAAPAAEPAPLPDQTSEDVELPLDDLVPA
jgi:hypothetical protein